MGKDVPAPPTPVDPAALGQAQTASNQQTSLYQSRLDNPNYVGPYGSVTHAYDPSANQWTQTTTLSPVQQQLLNSTQQGEQTALNVSNKALGQTVAPGQMQTGVQGGQIQTGLGDIASPDAIQRAEQATFGNEMQFLAPQMAQQKEQNDAYLAAQGLSPNSASFQNEQNLFNIGQGQQMTGAANNAVLSGQNEQNTLFGQGLQSGEFANSAQAQGFSQGLQNANLGNSAESALFGQQTQAQMLPIQEVAALAGGGQVQAPNGQFTPVQTAPTDVMGAYGLSAQQQQNAYQSQMKNQQSMLGGLFNLGASAMAFM